MSFYAQRSGSNVLGPFSTREQARTPLRRHLEEEGVEWIAGEKRGSEIATDADREELGEVWEEDPRAG